MSTGDPAATRLHEAGRYHGPLTGDPHAGDTIITGGVTEGELALGDTVLGGPVTVASSDPAWFDALEEAARRSAARLRVALADRHTPAVQS